jgi:hypothetical protein
MGPETLVKIDRPVSNAGFLQFFLSLKNLCERKGYDMWISSLDFAAILAFQGDIHTVIIGLVMASVKIMEG